MARGWVRTSDLAWATRPDRSIVGSAGPSWPCGSLLRRDPQDGRSGSVLAIEDRLSASVAGVTPSLLNADVRWLLTLLPVTNSFSAVSALEKSSTTIARTWRSHGDSGGRCSSSRIERGTTPCPAATARSVGRSARSTRSASTEPSSSALAARAPRAAGSHSRIATMGPLNSRHREMRERLVQDREPAASV